MQSKQAASPDPCMQGMLQLAATTHHAQLQGSLLVPMLLHVNIKQELDEA
jgi:hypothetical protein